MLAASAEGCTDALLLAYGLALDAHGSERRAKRCVGAS